MASVAKGDSHRVVRGRGPVPVRATKGGAEATAGDEVVSVAVAAVAVPRPPAQVPWAWIARA